MPRDTTGLRPRKPLWSDAALCKLVWELRETTGACSIGQLAKVTDRSREATRKRLETLRSRGLVEWSSAAGSIRTTDETTFRAPPKEKS